ncbi:hypothetical protein N7486_002253 [Penicillium sp. IBT 16267x]|nr:hypothetical protein N7486_002253 [Penicillium sp. IBT 16267x]
MVGYFQRVFRKRSKSEKESRENDYATQAASNSAASKTPQPMTDSSIATTASSEMTHSKDDNDIKTKTTHLAQMENTISLHPLENPVTKNESELTQTSLWGAAYDLLKEEKETQELLVAYESLLSRVLVRDDATSLPGPNRGEDIMNVENQIPQKDPTARREMLTQIAKSGLKHMEDKKAKFTIFGDKVSIQDIAGQIGKAVDWAQSYVKDAVKDVPYAPAVMAGISLILPLLKNPATIDDVNRQGFTYVTSQMRYYVEMEFLLLEDMKPGLKTEMTKRVIDLYKLIIEFQSIFEKAFLGTNTQQLNKLAREAEISRKALNDVFDGIQKLMERNEQRFSNAEYQRRRGRLQAADPTLDKDRIEQEKGGLLIDSYCWVLDHPDFRRWQDAEFGQLLWIRGDPGKGKTMLVCGIIDELLTLKTAAPDTNISFFFCQATNSDINSATAVLRGLIYSLVSQQPSLADHINDDPLEGRVAWQALCNILTRILESPQLNTTYLIIDALDECTEDLPKLLTLLTRMSSEYSHIKWIVSSRNWPSIEKDLSSSTQLEIRLELNENTLSSAIDSFIQYKVNKLAAHNRYTPTVRDAVHQHLKSNASGTFLWVALVCQRLAKVASRNVQKKLEGFPPGLDELYKRMWNQIGRTISLVHQSAKDFLLREEADPDGIERIHHSIFSKSLKIISKVLKRDIYGLCSPGYPVTQVKQPDPDPLAAAKYACVYWVDHLTEYSSSQTEYTNDDLQGSGLIMDFLLKDFLHWVEALSLLRSLAKGVTSMMALESFLKTTTRNTNMIERVQGARRFLLYHKVGIEGQPLQVYASGLVFSPTHSVTRIQYETKETIWMKQKPIMENNWNACLQTLEGHRKWVRSVTFSHDSKLLASASEDKTIKVWDANSGHCLQTLEGHNGSVTSVTFNDSKLLASASGDQSIKIWDTDSGQCLQTLKGHSHWVRSITFSRDSKLLASASDDQTIKVWDANSGYCLQTLEGHSGSVTSVTFNDSKLLASGSYDQTIKVWDSSSGECLQTLKSHKGFITSITFYDSKLLASASGDRSIKIWDTSSGQCLQTLEGHSGSVTSVTFNDSKLLASASDDQTIKVWDANSGYCLQTLEGHSGSVTSVIFNDSKLLASASGDQDIKIWDASSGQCLQTLKGHSDYITSITFSHDSKLLASVSVDQSIIKIWDTSSGQCLQTLEGHSNWVSSITFSHESKLLASASNDKTIKVRDANSGHCLQTLEGHSHRVSSVTFSYDSKLLASASDDQTVKVWDVGSGQFSKRFMLK